MALKRIVARLLAFADLAERACDRPLAIRILVLFILRYAERVAWEFVTGETQLPDETMPSGNSPHEAALLAQRFSELACLLNWQINYGAALEILLPDDPLVYSRLGVDRIGRLLDGVAAIIRVAACHMPRATGPPVSV